MAYKNLVQPPGDAPISKATAPPAHAPGPPHLRIVTTHIPTSYAPQARVTLSYLLRTTGTRHPWESAAYSHAWSRPLPTRRPRSALTLALALALALTLTLNLRPSPSPPSQASPCAAIADAHPLALHPKPHPAQQSPMRAVEVSSTHLMSDKDQGDAEEGDVPSSPPTLK